MDASGFTFPKGKVAPRLVAHDGGQRPGLFLVGLQEAHVARANHALIIKPVFAGDLPLFERVGTVEFKANARIAQKQVCRFMTVTAVLLIIWMVVRSAKYFIFWQPDAVRYLWYLFYLPMLFVPMLALLIAMLLNHTLRGMGLFRTLFYLPTICGGVGMFLLWGYIFAPETGLLNQLLALVGISGPGWLTNYHWAKPALMLMGLWGAMGGVNMLLYLSALQGIPAELYEAAEIDGAGRFRKFVSLTVPLLAPTNFFIFVMSVILSLIHI